MSEQYELIQVLQYVEGTKMPKLLHFSEEIQAEAQIELGEELSSYLELDEASFQLFAEIPMIPDYPAEKLIKYFLLYGIPGCEEDLPTNVLFKLQDRRFYIPDGKNIYEI